MSTRRLQARLDRVARSLDIAGGTGQTDEDRLHEFTIDPELAEMLCKDSEHLNSLNSRFWEALTAEETAELAALKERVPSLANKVVLPVPYGRDELCRDRNRVNELRERRLRMGHSKETDDIEETQLTARMLAYSYQTDEGRAWRRIDEIMWPDRYRTIAELDEVHRLHALYPPLPPDPDGHWGRLANSLDAMRNVLIEGLNDEKLRHEKFAKKYPNRR
jgi:hypothetical protein